MDTNIQTERQESATLGDRLRRRRVGKQANLQISSYRAILGLESAARDLAMERRLPRSSRSQFSDFEEFASEIKNRIFELIQTSDDEQFSGMPLRWAKELARFAEKVRSLGNGERLAVAIEAFAQGCFFLENSLGCSADDRDLSHGLAAYELTLIICTRELSAMERNRKACA